LPIKALLLSFGPMIP